jgi:hypothetical protein
MCGLIGRLPFAMLNEQMLKAGFAYLRTIPANAKYLNRFLKCSCLASLPDKGTLLF